MGPSRPEPADASAARPQVTFRTGVPFVARSASGQPKIATARHAQAAGLATGRGRVKGRRNALDRGLRRYEPAAGVSSDVGNARLFIALNHSRRGSKHSGRDVARAGGHARARGLHREPSRLEPRDDVPMIDGSWQPAIP